jgi:hypothetical protein
VLLLLISFIRKEHREKLLRLLKILAACLIFGTSPIWLWADEPSEDTIRKYPTFHRKISGFDLSLTPSEMNYMLDNFPYASDLVRRFEIHSLWISEVSQNSYRAHGKGKFEGTFMVLRKDAQFREFMGKGRIGSVFGDISASVVASIRYQENGLYNIKNEVEFWVLIDNVLVDLICRIFRPLLQSILTEKIKVFIGVAQELAVKIRENPELLNNSSPITPEHQPW